MVFIPQQKGAPLPGAPQKGNTLAPSQQRDNIDWLCKRAIGFFVASPEKNSQSWKPEDYVCKHGLDIFLIDLYTIPERRFYPLHSLATHEKQKFLVAGML